MLLSHQQVSLVRRELHACDLLHVVRDHDEIHLADVRLVRIVINVTNRNVVTYMQSVTVFQIINAWFSNELTDRVDYLRIVKKDQGVFESVLPCRETCTKGITKIGR